MTGHVELLGLPAAGKTTLVEGLRRGALAGGPDIVAPLTRAPVTPVEKAAKRYRDIATVLRQILGSPVKSLGIWRACAAFPQPSRSLQIRMYLSCLRVESLARGGGHAASRNRIVVLDQGVLQAVWSLALRAEIPPGEGLAERCRMLLRLLARPALVILLDTPADIAVSRLADDPASHGRLPALLASDPAWLDRAREILDALWKIACEDPEIRTFRYDPARNTLDDVKRAIEAV